MRIATFGIRLASALAAGGAAGLPATALGQAGPLELDGGMSLSARGMLADIAYVPSAVSNGNGLSISVDGAGGFALWSDTRNFYDGTLYGTRLGANGAVLDPGGFRVGPRGPTWKAVAFAGQHLAAVQDSYDHLLLYRISPASGLVSATPVTVANVPSLYRINMACAAQTCLVAWVANDGLYAMRLDAQLAALDATPIKLGSGIGSFTAYTGVASDGTGFLVAGRLTVGFDGGTASNQIATSRVTVTGTTTPLRPLALGAVYDVNLAGGNGRYLVAGATSFSGPYVALRLDANGVPVDAAPFSFAPANSALYWPFLVTAGTDFWVLWYESGTGATTSTFKGARIPALGSAGSPAAQVLSTSAIGRRIDAAAGSPTGPWIGAALATTTVTTENQPTLLRHDGAGTNLDGAGIPIRLVPDTQDKPAVAWGGGGYLAVWEGNRSTPYLPQTYARRFDADGNPLGAPFPMVVSTAPQRAPAVASDGTQFLVTWNERVGTNSAVRAARVSAQGAVLDAAGITVSPTGSIASEAKVAFAGGVFGVVWAELEAVTLQAKDIRLARVSPQGAVLDATPIDVMVDIGYAQDQPAIFSSGTQFLVAWSDSRGGLSPQLYGTRVSAHGAVLDAPRINVSGRSPTGTTGMSDYAPSAAWANGEWLVVYNTETTQMAASRVSGGGTLLEALRKLTFPGGADIASPSATAHDGQRFRFLWDDRFTAARHGRYGSWDTSTDGGPGGAGLWNDTMDSLAMAQSAPDRALLVSSGPLLAGLPLLERGWRRAVRFCGPGTTCPAPGLGDDGGVPDAGVTDAGSGYDAGARDAGAADAGPQDSGVAVDAGGPSADAGTAIGMDAGEIADAGTGTAPPGCGCQATRGPLAGALAALATARRRRRQ